MEQQPRRDVRAADHRPRPAALDGVGHHAAPRPLDPDGPAAVAPPRKRGTELIARLVLSAVAAGILALSVVKAIELTHEGSDFGRGFWHGLTGAPDRARAP